MTTPSFHATQVHGFAGYILLHDREDGGRRLAEKLAHYRGAAPRPPGPRARRVRSWRH